MKHRPLAANLLSLACMVCLGVASAASLAERNNVFGFVVDETRAKFPATWANPAAN